MTQDWQKNLELVVKVLLGVVAGVVALWLAGWVLRLIAGLFLGVAGLLLALLKFIVPVAVIAGIVYVAVGALRPKSASSQAPQVIQPTPSEPVTPAPTRATVELDATPSVEATVKPKDSSDS